MDFLINVNFWGADYTKLFLEYCLPSQLAPNNLPFLVKENQGSIRYWIYTTREDAVAIRQSAAFERLCGMMETKIIYLEEIDTYGKHNRGTMTLCHAHAIDFANQHDYSLIFIWPDTIFSHNAFATLFNLAKSGKKNVLCGSLTAKTSSFLEEFDRTAIAKGHAFDLAPRPLVELCSRHLCDLTLNWFWDSPTFCRWPQSFIFWHVPGEGILERAVHLIPFLITPENKSAKLTYNPVDEMAIDSSAYLGEAIPDFSTVHVVDDSDDLFILSLNHLDLTRGPERSSITDLAIFGKDLLYPHNVHLFRHKIRFHYAELSPQWEQVESYSEAIAQRFYAMLELLDRYPEIHRELKTIRKETFAAGENHRLQQQLVDAAGALYKAGNALYQVRSFDKAASTWHKVLDIVPGNIQTHLDLARTYAAMDNYVETFKHLQPVLQAYPEHPEALAIANSLIN